jgi:hypothetical protein
MKKLSILLVIAAGMLVYSCIKDKKSERFILLTTPVWIADSLLADGVDASGPGQLLENFNGDAKFKEDGTGYFGGYTGEWSFSHDETKLTINTETLLLPITCNIVELTTLSLKITTSVINPVNTSDLIDIRMTFKAR